MNRVRIETSMFSGEQIPFAIATGESRVPQGARKFIAWADDVAVNFSFEVTDVQRPQLSVRDLYKMGYVVELTEWGGTCWHRRTRHVIKLNRHLPVGSEEIW
jgi:hypothetical protein